MPNIYRSALESGNEYSSLRLAEEAGAERLGVTLYELAPGQGMVFHYHLQREELLVLLSGTLSLRTAAGWRDVAEGEVIAFPRGEAGAHGYQNRGRFNVADAVADYGGGKARIGLSVAQEDGAQHDS